MWLRITAVWYWNRTAGQLGEGLFCQRQEWCQPSVISEWLGEKHTMSI